eukprot:3934552-Rhodomonas_salina.3
MSGTDLPYAATLATRCPVLTYCMLLPAEAKLLRNRTGEHSSRAAKSNPFHQISEQTVPRRWIFVVDFAVCGAQGRYSVIVSLGKCPICLRASSTGTAYGLVCLRAATGSPVLSEAEAEALRACIHTAKSQVQTILCPYARPTPRPVLEWRRVWHRPVSALCNA